MSSRPTRAPTVHGAKRDEHGFFWLLGGLEDAGVVDTTREQSGRAED